MNLYGVNSGWKLGSLITCGGRACSAVEGGKESTGVCEGDKSNVADSVP